MNISLDILIHIVAGTLALLAGAYALVSHKGGAHHKQAGKVFLVSMAVMATTGGIIAFFLATYITLLVACLTFYLLLSGWFAFTRVKMGSKFVDKVFLAAGITITAAGLLLAWRSQQGVTDNIDGYLVPTGVYLFFSSIALLASLGDLTVLLRTQLSFSYTLCRHLWRMCIALYLAAVSFFDGQADIFPAMLQQSAVLATPPNLVLLIMVFWLVKIALGRRLGKSKS